MIITSQGDRKKYDLPKGQIDGLNGAEVFLKIGLDELENLKSFLVYNNKKNK